MKLWVLYKLKFLPLYSRWGGFVCCHSIFESLRRRTSYSPTQSGCSPGYRSPLTPELSYTFSILLPPMGTQLEVGFVIMLQTDVLLSSCRVLLNNLKGSTGWSSGCGSILLDNQLVRRDPVDGRVGRRGRLEFPQENLQRQHCRTTRTASPKEPQLRAPISDAVHDILHGGVSPQASCLCWTICLVSDPGPYRPGLSSYPLNNSTEPKANDWEKVEENNLFIKPKSKHIAFSQVHVLASVSWGEWREFLAASFYTSPKLFHAVLKPPGVRMSSWVSPELLLYSAMSASVSSESSSYSEISVSIFWLAFKCF